MRSLVARFVGLPLACLLLARCTQFGATSPEDAGVDSGPALDSGPAPAIDASTRLARELDLTKETLPCKVPQISGETAGEVAQVPGAGLRIRVGTGVPDVSSIVCTLPPIPQSRSRVVVDYAYVAATGNATDSLSVVGIAAQVRLNKPKIDAASVSLKAYTRAVPDSTNGLALVVDFDGAAGQLGATPLTVTPTLDLSLSYDFVPERGAARLTGPSVALQVQTADVAETLDLSGGIEPSLNFSNYGGRREVIVKRVRIYELPPP
jgi:hypothetical protein